MASLLSFFFLLLFYSAAAAIFAFVCLRSGVDLTTFHRVLCMACFFKLESLLNQSLDMLHKHAGWGYDAVGVGRTLLTSLISKITKNMSRWKHDVDCYEWVNILKLATIVEDFMFHRPTQTADNQGDNPQTGMPFLLRRGMASGSVVRRRRFKPSSYILQVPLMKTTSSS